MNPDLLSPKPQDCVTTRSTLASSPSIPKRSLSSCAEVLCLCQGLRKRNISIGSSSITGKDISTDCPGLGEYGYISELSLCIRSPPFLRHLAAAQEGERRCSPSTMSEPCHDPKLQAMTAQGNAILLW